MSRRLIAALLVTGALSGALVGLFVRPDLPSVLPSVLGGDDEPADQPDRVADAFVNIVAQGTVPTVAIYEQPDAGTQPKARLANPTEIGAPLVFLVRGERTGWLQVLLPVRPNGSLGWVRTTDVITKKHEFKIVIELTAHKLTVFHRDGVFLEEQVGVGRGPTPTPVGVFYTKELLQPPNPNTAYGAYAYGLSGYSNVLTDFAGGDGVVGIHGTNDPSTLGKDVSHGCIRLSNAAITRMAQALPLGVPVVIQP